MGFVVWRGKRARWVGMCVVGRIGCCSSMMNLRILCILTIVWMRAGYHCTRAVRGWTRYVKVE